MIDGDPLRRAGETLRGEVTGPLRPILTAERTALEFQLSRPPSRAWPPSRPSSSKSRSRAQPRRSKILDTRKTMPGLRAARKGCRARRGWHKPQARLSDAVLVKDNHLAGTTITDTVAPSAPDWPGVAGRLVEIECDTLDQVAEAAKAGADAVLLDNMGSTDRHRGHTSWHAETPPDPILTEVSGGVTLATVGLTRRQEPDRISVGALHPLGTGARPRSRPSVADVGFAV